MHGRVLYRDILEQKGLLIYLIQIPAYLISHTTFLGVWIIQTILMAITAILGYKLAITAKLKPLFSFIAVTSFALIIFTSYSLSSSQIVELYVLPCFVASIYTAYKYYCIETDIPIKSLFINGLLAGILLWTKYSLLGFYFAWMAVICFRSLFKKHFLKAIKEAFSFILGMVVITIPCVLYFAVNHALNEMFRCYFMNNISGYGNEITLNGLLGSYEWTFVRQLELSTVLCIAIFVSLVLVLIKKKSATLKIMFCSCFAVQFITVYLHGAMMSYYFFAFAPFALIGTIGISQILQSLCQKRSFKESTKIITTVICSVIILIGSIGIAVNNQPRPARFLENSDNLAQYKFAEYMNKKYDNPTLLDFNELDGGFYTAADITPSTWAYCALNWDNPQMDKDRIETVKDKKVDFVVLRVSGSVDFIKTDWPVELTENYTVVDRVEQYRVSDLFTYFLLEKK